MTPSELAVLRDKVARARLEECPPPGRAQATQENSKYGRRYATREDARAARLKTYRESKRRTVVTPRLAKEDKPVILEELSRLRAEIHRLRSRERALRKSRDFWREEARGWRFAASRRAA